MEDKQFEPSYWVIIRNNKKYLGCQNNCKHLENIDNKVTDSYDMYLNANYKLSDYLKWEYSKEFLGRKEGETEQDYLERIRELNKKFADAEKEFLRIPSLFETAFYDPKEIVHNLVIGYSSYEDSSYLSKFINYSSALKVLEVE